MNIFENQPIFSWKVNSSFVLKYGSFSTLRLAEIGFKPISIRWQSGFTTDSDDDLTFEYSAFYLTDVAKVLIEIPQIETNDDFFRNLLDTFKTHSKSKLAS
ncbi:hypothetical protein [Streptococcus cuniculi]|nr:hypothetical protein [Streptococcus cuniculi]